MGYELGKLSANLGKLRVVYLNHGIVDVKPLFQLPVAPMPVAHAAPARTGRERRKFNRPQVAMMGKMVEELNEFDLDFDPDPQSVYAILDRHRISGAEFVFHGSKVTWDAIYESGGFTPAGDTTSISDHVHSAHMAESGYISGTRSLAVAHSFASGQLDRKRGQYGFVYMFHVEGGGIVNPNLVNHSQAEVFAYGLVPIRDILMFKWLAQPRKIYINRQYTATPMAEPMLNRCMALLGGGATR